MNTRRDFLTCCSLLAASAALDPMDALAAPLLRRVSFLDPLQLSTFVQCLHTPFHVIRGGRESVQLELIEAGAASKTGPVRSSQSSAVEEAFSLLFQGPRDVPLVQDTYSFEHEALGRFLMFIVPVCRPGGNECTYEAVFNPGVEPAV